MVIVARTSDCQCQCQCQLAIELLLNCDSMTLVFYVNLLICNVLLLWKTLQKAYFLQFWNCKKLKFWNCKKLNLWNVFTSNFFTVSKLQKKLLMGTAISYFIILLPLPLPLFEKAHFFSFKTKKKKLERSEKEMFF